MKKVEERHVLILIVVIGILFTITTFLPSMAFPNSERTFLGYEFVLGTEFANLGTWASGNIHFSVLGMLAYFLPIGAVLSVMFLKKGYLYSALLFAVSMVLLFLLPSYTKTTITLINTTTEVDVAWVVLYGLTLARIFTVFGLIISTIATMMYQIKISKKN